MAALSRFHVHQPDGAFCRAAGEVLLFLWTVLALAFSVLVMAGFFA
jgi:hypothetical protein